jgi:hypothetical protein
MIDPNDGKQRDRDPEEGNIPTGLYLCELSRVSEVAPSAKFPNGNPRLVFEFTLCDPNYPALRGKKAVTFLGKTLHKSKEGKESNLVKWARMMGVANPERGFDPDTLLNKRFNVMVELTPGTNGEPGRGWARQAMLAVQQAAASPQPQPSLTASGSASTSGTIGTPGPNAGDPNARWDAHDGAVVTLNKSSAEVQAIINECKCDANKIWVKPAGTPREQSKTADQYGFLNGSSIPW